MTNSPPRRLANFGQRRSGWDLADADVLVARQRTFPPVEQLTNLPAGLTRAVRVGIGIGVVADSSFFAWADGTRTETKKNSGYRVAVLLVQTLALALLMKEGPGTVYKPHVWVAPSGYVLTGVGLHAHESPLPSWALELKLGPKLVYQFNRKDALAIRFSPGWGMETNSARPLEHFGLFEIGVAAELMNFFSVEYSIGAQVGVFDGKVDPAFRHGVAWRFLYMVGPEIQHYVARPSATSDAHSRQVVRIMLSFDLAYMIYWRLKLY